MPHYRLLRIQGDRINYTPDAYCRQTATNLPSGSLRFRAHRPFFWKVRIVEYRPTEACIRLEVVDYQPKDTECFLKQTPQASLQRIEFEPLDWKQLQTFLSYYRQDAALAHVLQNSEQDSPAAVPVETEIRDIGVPWSELRFEAGFVAFDYQPPGWQEAVIVRIANSHLLPEFGYVYPWFVRALPAGLQFRKGKEIQVRMKWRVEHQEYQLQQAESPQIRAINSQLIDSVKRIRLLEAIKQSIDIPIDRSLFTADEFFDAGKDPLPSQAGLHPTEADALRILLEERKVRNSRQLLYLADHPQAAGHKIRFTLSPDFGFLFTLVSEDYYHFCWELLNSHATYLWTFDRQEIGPDRCYRRVERSINHIRDHGRRRYKTAYRHREIDSDVAFTAVQHQKANSSLVDGFVYWKARLEEILK
jgi:hypothetical protein